MKRLLSFSLAVFCCFCLLIATEQRAMAYVDPGSGLLALQTLASVLAGFAYIARRRIQALFRKGTKRKNTETPILETKKEVSKTA